MVARDFQRKNGLFDHDRSYLETAEVNIFNISKENSYGVKKSYLKIRTLYQLFLV